jgi:hypothetical protein
MPDDIPKQVKMELNANEKKSLGKARSDLQ